MTLQIIGKIKPENNQLGFYGQPVTRQAQCNDVVYDYQTGEYSRLIWNHNGQRLTSVIITDLVVSVWAKSELDADRLAAQIDADRIVATHGERIRQQISRAGFQQLSQRLTLVQRRQQLQAVQ